MKAEMGSISYGTMRPEDLITAFADELARLDTEGEYRGLLSHVDTLAAVGAYGSEVAEWALMDLFDALDTFAPDGCYFGAHEGDGADYGFWPIEADDDDNNEEA